LVNNLIQGPLLLAVIKVKSRGKSLNHYLYYVWCISHLAIMIILLQP